MKYADKISMKYGCEYSNKQIEIRKVHILNLGWFNKEDIYDYIKYSNGTVKVNISPYPSLIPVLSAQGEKYVRSVSDETIKDNLMSLPRE